MIRKSFLSSLTNGLPIFILVVLVFVISSGCTMVTGGGPFFRVQKYDSLVAVEIGAKIILQEVDGGEDDIASAKLWTGEVVDLVGVATDKNISAAR